MGSCPQDSCWPQDLLTPKESGLKNYIASSSVMHGLVDGFLSSPCPTIYLGTKSHEHCYIYGNMRIYFLLICACFTFLTFVVRKNDRSDALFGKYCIGIRLWDKVFISKKNILCFLSAGRLKPLHTCSSRLLTVTEEVHKIDNRLTSINITAMSHFLNNF